MRAIKRASGPCIGEDMLNSDAKFAVKVGLSAISVFALALSVYSNFETAARIVAQNVEALSVFACLGVILNAAIFAGMAAHAPNRYQQAFFGFVSAFMALQVVAFLIDSKAEVLQVCGLVTTMVLSAAAARAKEVGEITERVIGHLLGAFCSLLMVAIVSG